MLNGKMDQNLFTPNANFQITQQLRALEKEIYVTNTAVCQVKQDDENVAFDNHKRLKLNAQIHQLQSQDNSCQNNAIVLTDLFHQRAALEKTMKEKVTEIRKSLSFLTNKLGDTLTYMERVQLQILQDELLRWKRQQQLQGNGIKFNNDLDTIQEWCQKLAELIWLIRHQIRETEILQKKLNHYCSGMGEMLPNLSSRITELLSSLVTSTFVIEKQPQQVIKTNTKILSAVRLLVGPKLQIDAEPPKVLVSIINEEQSKNLLKGRRKVGCEVSGEILNNSGAMAYDQSGRLCIDFKKLQLKKIRRAERKGTESVMDEKFALLFQSKFSVGGGELVFQVWTLSLPVVVVVHGSQDPYAWATVTWDNAFAEAGRIPFVVSHHVPWPQVANMLNMKFKAATGCLLTGENLNILAEKIFRVPATDHSEMIVNYSQFCKDTLPERSFSFWEWFYAVMKLTREHLRDIWRDGCVLGFIRKREAEKMLSTCMEGTFLLRFSDSELGGITIAWLGEHKQVYMLQPFTAKDFAIRTLPDRISDLHHLTHLYPHIPKYEAFGKYYSPITDMPTVNGYVKPLLVTHVPGLSAMCSASYLNASQFPFQSDASLLNDMSSINVANDSGSSGLNC